MLSSVTPGIDAAGGQLLKKTMGAAFSHPDRLATRRSRFENGLERRSLHKRARAFVEGESSPSVCAYLDLALVLPWVLGFRQR